MAEEAVKAETAQIVAQVKRCAMCPGVMDDEGHKDGVCGFYQRLKALVTAANGGITVWA